MSYTASDIGDIVKFFLEDYQADTWRDAARNYTHYICAEELFTKRLATGDASEKCTWNLKVAQSGNTRTSAFFKKDTYNRVDLGVKGEAKWSFQDTHMILDVREPAFMNRNRLQILNYLKMQKSDMYDGFFEANEEWLWSLAAAPNDGSSGDVVVNGIPRYIVPSATAEFGFNGGHPSGYSDVGGLSRTTYPKLKNGTATYSSVDDLEKKLTRALNKCRFKSPYKGSAALGEKQPATTYGLYSSYKPWEDWQTSLYDLNDNIGPDRGKYRGAVNNELGVQMYRGIPWYWVDVLTNEDSPARNLNEPIYGLNWDTWKVKQYGDLFMKYTDMKAVPDSHNTMAAFMDTGYQLVCESYRENFVIQSTTASAA